MDKSINEQKSAMRAEIGSRLRAQPPEVRRAKSAQVCQRLMSLEAFRHASTVMIYMPLPQEVDVTPVALRCFQMGASVCVPRVNWERHDILPIEVEQIDDESMEVDEHGVRVPRAGRIVVPSTIDMVVIPGVAFDMSGNRLGRGGGYYDRFLPKLSRQATRVAVAFDEQIVEQIPVQPHDAKVDHVVTDRRSMRTTRPTAR